MGVSLVLSRTSGVGPLAVFFDMSATTSAFTTRPFAELKYLLNFGDPSSGNHPNSGLPRNLAYGPLACHVYGPGTYTATLYVYNPDMSLLGSATATITVTDPDSYSGWAGTNTICFSTSGDFTGAPAGANLQTLSSWALIKAFFASGKRLLFRAGESWTLPSNTAAAFTGTTQFGSFGPGAKPVFNFTGGGATVFSIGGSDDLRFLDIKIDGGTAVANLRPFSWSTAVTPITNLLILRVDTTHIHEALEIGTGTTVGIHDGIFWIDSTGDNYGGGSGGNGLFLQAKRAVIMGASIDHCSSIEHTVRVGNAVGLLISHSYLAHQATTKHLLKCHAVQNNSWVGTTTQYGLISDNVFDDTSGVGGPHCVYGPQNNSDPGELVSDIIHERNHHKYNADTSANGNATGVWCAGHEQRVRNCTFVLPNMSSGYTAHAPCAVFWEAQSDQTVDHVYAENNSMFILGSIGSQDVQLVDVQGTVTNSFMYNNLASFPSAGGTKRMIRVNGGAGSAGSQGGNLLTNTPDWVVSSPVNQADFALNGNVATGKPCDNNDVSDGGNTGSVARDGIFQDAVRLMRPAGTRVDIGAFEFAGAAETGGTSPPPAVRFGPGRSRRKLKRMR